MRGKIAAALALLLLFTSAASADGWIKWVEFQVPYAALDKAVRLDAAAHERGFQAPLTEMLAALAAQYGGDYRKYKEKDLAAIYARMEKGETARDIAKDSKLYRYYSDAYDAALGGFMGAYRVKNAEGAWETRYGLRCFSPLAAGFGYSHCDDFGVGRSYGYKRRHLGHDMMCSVGTPVTAVETGRVEVMGWNQYGGWRVGIRSLDGRRYYYYAHLRKDRPFHADLREGEVVNAGDVIGYVGRTGYSRTENVNNLTTSHLHFGLQLIFDESQKECDNEIWIDVYSIVRVLERNRAEVTRVAETKEFYRKNEWEYMQND